MSDINGPGQAGLDRTAQISTGADVARGYNYDEPLPPLSSQDQATVEALKPRTAILIVQRGPNTGARFLLDEDETSAGRHPSSDIFLDDVTVSRRHSVFVRTPEGFAVRDVGSLNGTYVNNSMTDEARLTDGDEVRIGKFRLVFYQGR